MGRWSLFPSQAEIRVCEESLLAGQHGSQEGVLDLHVGGSSNPLARHCRNPGERGSGYRVSQSRYPMERATESGRIL